MWLVARNGPRSKRPHSVATSRDAAHRKLSLSAFRAAYVSGQRSLISAYVWPSQMPAWISSSAFHRSVGNGTCCAVWIVRRSVLVQQETGSSSSSESGTGTSVHSADARRSEYAWPRSVSGASPPILPSRLNELCADYRARWATAGLPNRGRRYASSACTCSSAPFQSAELSMRTAERASRQGAASQSHSLLAPSPRDTSSPADQEPSDSRRAVRTSP